MAKKAGGKPKTIRNRKARHSFELLDTMECGIVLRGTEVKSLRDGQGSLEEAFARIHDQELWLYAFHIPPYDHGNVHNHDPTRRRKLLMHKREIARLATKLTLKGQTLVPLDLYFNDRGIAKLTLALATGRNRRDKRQDLQERDAKREMDRAMRRG